MIVVHRPRIKRSRARRRSIWHSRFVVYRRFYCPRRRASVTVMLGSLERRRDPGCRWEYRTLEKKA